ncbi:MAG: R2-like ligand-binding oxidase [Candidatus Sulfomarinibacteraceae bacterium]
MTVTTTRTLDRDSLPMILWAKAKKLGVWNPADIDLEKDRDDWLELTGQERETLLHLTTLFAGGEEAVTVDLLPLISVIAAEGRIEEEVYLTSFLWEEAKHVDAFHRFLTEVTGDPGDRERFHSPSYRALFFDELPRALNKLREDASPAAQARASVTYNLIVEGVLAETGYHAYHAMLERNAIMPGMLEMIARLKTDESRHIAYGVHLLSRLVEAHGEDIWMAIQARMAELLPLAIGVISEIFDRYDEMAFGLDLAEFTDFATAQFESRFKRIERASSR